MIKVKLDNKTKEFIRSKMSLIEENTSGIYFLMYNEKIVYVGKSKNIRIRIHQHISGKTKVFNDFKFILCDENLLESTELSYIYHYDPIFNKKDSLTDGIDIKVFCDNNSIYYEEIEKNSNYNSSRKISKQLTMKEANLTERQYTYMRDKNPKRLELIKKGILYEQIESKEIAKEKL